MSDLRTVLIIRHGSTLLNSDNVLTDRLRGWMDVPLSDQGRQEAEAVLLPSLPSVLYSSDLGRAVETAEIIGKAPIFKDKRFRPWNIGEYAGKPAAEASPILGRYADQKPLEPVPGGESFDSFRHRFFGGLCDACHDYSGIIAIVTHHRCERLLKAWESYGFRLDGSIDQDEFTRKGIQPGRVEVMKIPMDRLLHAAKWPQILEIA